MKVGFFGPPCSGKTTLAHALFASIKQKGWNAEFVSEYARKFIAMNRERIIKKGMNDQDQLDIFRNQCQEEGYFDNKDTLVVTDTCSANTCFYSDQLENLVFDNIERYDIIFVTYFNEEVFGKVKDLNRIHDVVNCRELNIRMFDAISKITKYSNLTTDVFCLSGTLEDKVSASISYVEEKVYGIGNTKKSN